MSGMEMSSQAFVAEAEDLLESIEADLLELESDPGNTDRIAAIFRALHTIKGSGSMFGFEEIGRFTHNAETVFDRIREGKVEVTQELLTLALQANDHIRKLLECGEMQGTPELMARSDELKARFREYLGIENADTAEDGCQQSDSFTEDTVQAVKAKAEEHCVAWVRYRPAGDVFMTGGRPLNLVKELIELGEARVRFTDDNIPALSELDPGAAYGFWDIAIMTSEGLDALLDVFIFEESSRFSVHEIWGGLLRFSDLGAILAQVPAIAEFDIAATVSGIRKGITEQLAKRSSTSAADTAEAASKPAATLRVDASRLDDLINMVGELVIIQSRLALSVAGELERAVTAAVSEDLERLTAEMRDTALSLRMVPIGSSYGVYKRLVRDLSQSLGKEIEFIAEGASTELDKTVIDQLKDPLVHILRNSLDHGVETPEQREAAGKPRKGTVRLEAAHTAGEVLIAVSDDGKGIDPAKILEKARSRGLVGEESSSLSEQEIFQFIFEPGFSTAESVSSVSGRGVGMDVVRRSIESLRGSIILDSQLGVGTKLTIRLPLTLAIIEGFHVRIGNESYIVPLEALRSFQERFVSVEDDEPLRIVETMEFMGEVVPCISLRKLLQVPGEQPEYERIVITQVGDEFMGLAVDKVVGRQQAVIKSMDEAYSHMKWISGTTVNGDGTIALILDVPQLVRFAQREFRS